MPTAPRQMITISLRDGKGCSDEKTDKLLKFLDKQSMDNMSFLVAEHYTDPVEGHYHGGLVFDHKVMASNVKNQINRLFPEFTTDQKKHAVKTDHWYNTNWYTEYCQKDDGQEDFTWIKHLPESPSYPDEYPFAAVDDKQDVRPVNPWYDKMEAQIIADERFQPPWTEEVILKALNTYMFKDRTSEVMTDPKAVQQKTRALLRYMIKYDGAEYSNKKFKTEHQENLEHSYCPKCDMIKTPFTRVVYKSPPTGS